MDPMCSVVAQVKGNEIQVLDEIVLRRATTEQACEEFETAFGNPAAGWWCTAMRPERRCIRPDFPTIR